MSNHQNRTTQSGVILLGMLVFVLLATLAGSSLIASSQLRSQRMKEIELLFAGDQFRRAILSYYNTVPPGGSRQLPPTLEALLEDKRFPMPIRHLRRLYPDPMTGRSDWDVIVVNGGIAGVKSTSRGAPVKRAGFPQMYESFSQAGAYSEWQFSLPSQ